MSSTTQKKKTDATILKKGDEKRFIHSAEGSNLFGLYKWGLRVR